MRYLPLSQTDRQQMLSTIGAGSIDDLFVDVPAAAQRDGLVDLPRHKGELEVETAAMAKYWCSDLENKLIDECLQLHGGYGFMWEYRVARAYADARVQRIYGGTNEIMKEIIARSILD